MVCTVYTTLSRGNYEFGRWSRAAVKKNSSSCKLVKEDRASCAAHNMELDNRRLKELGFMKNCS
jgi:hypothetical protein